MISDSNDVSFSIVENSPSILEDHKLYEDFVVLYGDLSVSTMDIRKRLDLTPKKYALLRRKALDENKVLDRDNKIKDGVRRGGKSKKPRVVKNYYEVYNGFVVKKSKDTKITYYGTYKTEEVAQEIVCRLKEVDWDKTELDRIRSEVLG